MIISENRTPGLPEFRELMRTTDNRLNAAARHDEAYFAGRNGTLLETDVYQALTEAAVGTPFGGSIRLVSGASFPDIVLGGYYGVEVKSTKSNSWRSIGSSILESTRIPSVERIFLTFGKLGHPVQFRSRPYEDCLYDISVTHYPRYQIDMDLKAGETIFAKMGVPYDELRKMDNPVAPVAAYYKSQLRQGESLWWAPDGNLDEDVAPATVRLWSALDAAEKNYFTIRGYALYPEILGASSTKYQRFALWLVTSSGVVNTNIRDQFSSGGRVDIRITDAVFQNLPGAFLRIANNYLAIADTIREARESVLADCWDVRTIQPNRLRQWISLVLRQVSASDRNAVQGLLQTLYEDEISAPYTLPAPVSPRKLRTPIVEYTRDRK